MSTPELGNAGAGFVPPDIPSRAGVSPIGTTSPNSGSSAATNSSYAPGAYTSGVTPPTTSTSYVFQDTDYQGVVLFNTASAVAVTLNSNVKENFAASVFNIAGWSHHAYDLRRGADKWRQLESCLDLRGRCAGLFRQWSMDSL